MEEILMQVNLDRLNMLHPSIRDAAISAYNECVSKGLNLQITQTMRTFAESDALYAIGRTKPGKKVTNSKAGQSYHNYGLALDFVMIVGGKPVWSVTDEWMEVVNIFKAHGFKWGGDWKSLKDYPHLEKTPFPWKTLLDLYNKKHFIPGTEYINL